VSVDMNLGGFNPPTLRQFQPWEYPQLTTKLADGIRRTITENIKSTIKNNITLLFIKANDKTIKARNWYNQYNQR